MNHPTAEEFEELKRRVEKLEQSGQQIQLLRTDVQETNMLLKRILPDVGTSREKLDALGRGQQELKQELHSHSEAWLNSLQESFEEVKSALVEIRTTQGSRNERFDRIESRLEATATRDDITILKTTQDEQGAKLDQILQLLQQKPGP